MKRQNGFTILEVAISTAILLIIAGTILGAITYAYRATAMADNTMIASSRNAQAVAAMREDLIQTSRNFAGNYAPFIDTDSTELRFRRIDSFSASTGRASYENFYTCYFLDTTKNILYRRHRDLSGNLLTTPPTEPLAAHVTVFTPVIDTDAKNVTVTLTTSKGESARGEDASTTRTVIIKPFNID